MKKFVLLAAVAAAGIASVPAQVEAADVHCRWNRGVETCVIVGKAGVVTMERDAEGRFLHRSFDPM